jgi:hypothetical protein
MLAVQESEMSGNRQCTGCADDESLCTPAPAGGGDPDVAPDEQLFDRLRKQALPQVESLT